MLHFAVAYAAFLAAHSLSAVRPVRAWLVARLGERRYLALYSLVSLVLLAWLVVAALRAPYVALWTPPAWAYAAPLALVPPALMLIGAGLARPNPLSVSFAGAGFDPARPGVVGLTRHPVLWGFALWAFAHGPPNGNVVAVSLFGGLGLFALAGLPLVDRRARRRLGPDWERLARRTSVLPFAAWRRGRIGLAPTAADFIGAGLGLLTALALLAGLHERLFGADPLAAVRAAG